MYLKYNIKLIHGDCLTKMLDIKPNIKDNINNHLTLRNVLEQANFEFVDNTEDADMDFSKHTKDMFMDLLG